MRMEIFAGVFPGVIFGQFLLLQAFDPAGVSAISGLCIFVVVDADEQDFACIFPDRFGVLLSADLIDGALRGAVPLEFYYQRRPA